MKHLSILFQDDYLVAVNKPNGVPVHRSSMAAQAEVFALQLLRNQLRQYVYPVHRLDSKTSGVLLFAFDPETTKRLQEEFTAQWVEKKYLAIVRGYFPDEVAVDHPLRNEQNKVQDAVTHFKIIRRSEIPLPFGGHATSRYSLIEASPQTGRWRQIRKHLNHLRHPIIGDRPHGCNKQNKLFKETWQMTTMLLHAHSLQITHPVTGLRLLLEAGLPAEFLRMEQELNLGHGI